MILRFFFSFKFRVGSRVCSLLAPSLIQNEILQLKNIDEFHNVEYVHAYVLDRCVRALELLLKYTNKNGENSLNKNNENSQNIQLDDNNYNNNYSKEKEHSSKYLLIQAQEQSLSGLNVDLFFLLLQDMIRQRTLDQVIPE